MVFLKAISPAYVITINQFLVKNTLKLHCLKFCRLFSDMKDVKVAEKEPKKTYILREFFDEEENFGKRELRPLFRPGRSWSENELRLKSNMDLHKLWYILLKEKNMLLTMQHAYKIRNYFFPNPERLDKINESMENLEKVVHERNDAYLLLETGEGADPPQRTITSFLGFTYKEQAKEHYKPANNINAKTQEELKQYEIPMLDYNADIMQRLYKEKQFIKKELDDYDKYFNLMKSPDHYRYKRSLRRSFQRIDQMPKAILEDNEKKQAIV